MTTDTEYYQEVPVMALLEGVCPNHLGDEVTIINAGGTPEFFEEQGWCAKDLPEENVNLWNGRLPGDLTDGDIEFKCPRGCVFTVAHNIFGDWNL